MTAETKPWDQGTCCSFGVQLQGLEDHISRRLLGVSLPKDKGECAPADALIRWSQEMKREGYSSGSAMTGRQGRRRQRQRMQVLCSCERLQMQLAYLEGWEATVVVAVAVAQHLRSGEKM
jgi:hypothetical protein